MNDLRTLSADYRVRPLDHLQWILEYRRSDLKGGRERWDALAYCRTTAGLETALSRLRQDGVVLDASLLASLLEQFPEPAPQAEPVLDTPMTIPEIEREAA